MDMGITRGTEIYVRKVAPLGDPVEVTVRGYELSLHDFKLLSAKAEYVDEVLQSMDCMTTTQVAKEMSMTGPDLYRLLLGLGVCYWQSGQYMLYAQYAREQLARTRTHTRRLPSGRVRTEVYLVWTQKGREFLHGLVK